MNSGPSLKKQEHLQPDDSSTLGDTWIWKAIALPSHLRVVNHLSHERSEPEAPTFLAAFKARTDGRPPLLTSDKLPASIAARIANDRTPEPPARRRGPGRPRQHPRRVLDPTLPYAQLDKHRAGRRIVAGYRRIVCGSTAVIPEMVGDQPINTAYVERDNLTSRQSHSRLVRKACHTPRRTITCNATSTWKTPFSILCVHIKHCTCPYPGQSIVESGSSVLLRWPQA